MVRNYMKFNVVETKLFDGLADLIAKEIKKKHVQILKLNSQEPQSHAFVGNAAAKTEEFIEIDVAGLLMECWANNDTHQLLENYKASLKKEEDRTEMWKSKYEEERDWRVDLEYKIEDMETAWDEERRQWAEEKKGLQEKIKELSIKLEYLEEHPQIQNIGVQFNTTSDAKSEVKRGNMKVEEMKVEEAEVHIGDTVTDKTNKKVPTENAIEDIKTCRFIVQEKIKNNTTYGKTEEERIDQYNRIIYRKSQKPFPKFAKFLKAENDSGNMGYEIYEQDYETIYEHFVECYHNLHGNFTSFRNACMGVMNGRQTGFYWNPHK